MRVIGHTSLNTSDRYVKLASETLRGVIESYRQRDGFECGNPKLFDQKWHKSFSGQNPTSANWVPIHPRVLCK
jgi:hypothetical protein